MVHYLYARSFSDSINVDDELSLGQQIGTEYRYGADGVPGSTGGESHTHIELNSINPPDPNNSFSQAKWEGDNCEELYSDYYFTFGMEFYQGNYESLYYTVKDSYLHHDQLKKNPLKTVQSKENGLYYKFCFERKKRVSHSFYMQSMSV